MNQLYTPLTFETYMYTDVLLDSEYEKLRRPVVQPRSRHPRNGSVVSETNLYEEPIVT